MISSYDQALPLSFSVLIFSMYMEAFCVNWLYRGKPTPLSSPRFTLERLASGLALFRSGMVGPRVGIFLSPLNTNDELYLSINYFNKWYRLLAVLKRDDLLMQVRCFVFSFFCFDPCLK